MAKINSIDLIQNKTSFSSKNSKGIKSNDNGYNDNKQTLTNVELMIGATTLASIVALGVAGYKGHLGKGIQKFLGGVEKGARKEGVEITPHNSQRPKNQPNHKNNDVDVNDIPQHKNDIGSFAPQKETPFETENSVIEKTKISDVVEDIQPEITKPVVTEKPTEIIEELSNQTVKPATVVDEQAEVKRQIEEYEMGNFKKELEIARSNDRNAAWLKKQHEIKEKKYSDFWNQDVIKASDITPETFIQTIKNIESGKTIRIMTDEGTIKSYTCLDDDTILFECGNKNGKIVETYKVVFTNKDENIAKCIKQNKNGEEEIEFVKFSKRGIVNLSAKEERGIREYTSRVKHGLNAKTFNFHKHTLLEYGFVEVDKTIKVGDETVHIVLEGLEHDVTADGKLLKKVFAQNGQINYKDVTTEYISKANERAMPEETRRVSERQRQKNTQRQTLFA